MPRFAGSPPAVMAIGWPERASSIQLTCQLPRIHDAAPPSLSQRLPCPNGSSQVEAQVRMCGMS